MIIISILLIYYTHHEGNNDNKVKEKLAIEVIAILIIKFYGFLIIISMLLSFGTQPMVSLESKTISCQRAFVLLKVKYFLLLTWTTQTSDFSLIMKKPHLLVKSLTLIKLVD